MRPDADDEAILDEVVSRLSAEGTVAAALGGSLGRGDATPTSDLDVLAVLAEGADDRFRRLLLHGRLVEVVGRTEAGWLAHLDSERPRWIYSLIGRVVVLFDDEGALQAIQQRAIEVMTSFRVSDEVKGELATLRDAPTGPPATRLPPAPNAGPEAQAHPAHGESAHPPERVSENRPVESTEARRAVTAAISVAQSLDLAVDEALVVNDSNRLVVRLVPCDVVARIVPVGYRVFAAAVGAEREVQVLRRLAAADAPVAALEPRIEPQVFTRDGFEIELLTYYEPVTVRAVPPEDYAGALERLHRALREIDVEAPHFTDRVADVQQWTERQDATPDLTAEDRELLVHTLSSLRQAVTDRAASEQLLHGEPHPWNVLDSRSGLRFVDFENCVRGPVEWDLGWVPSAVTDRYPGVDRDLALKCRGLVLAIVAAHCWRPEDERPGRESRTAFMDAVRAGPPWSALDVV